MMYCVTAGRREIARAARDLLSGNAITRACVRSDTVGRQAAMKLCTFGNLRAHINIKHESTRLALRTRGVASARVLDLDPSSGTLLVKQKRKKSHLEFRRSFFMFRDNKQGLKKFKD